MSYTRLKQLSALLSSTAPTDLWLHGENNCQSNNQTRFRTQLNEHGRRITFRIDNIHRTAACTLSQLSASEDKTQLQSRVYNEQKLCLHWTCGDSHTKYIQPNAYRAANVLAVTLQCRDVAEEWVTVHTHMQNLLHAICRLHSLFVGVDQCDFHERKRKWW